MTGNMKVLWFANTPSLADSVVARTGGAGGWIRSLEQELKGHVDLSVAFYVDDVREPFVLNGTTYHPLVRARRNTSGKILKRLTHALESEADVARLVSLVKDVRPDLIHIHGTEGAFGLIQRHTEVPVLISIQGLISVLQLKFFSGISQQSTRRFTTLRSELVRDSYSDQYRTILNQAKREQEILRTASFLTGRTDWDRRVTSVLAPQATYFPAQEILRSVFYEQTWKPRDHPELQLFSTTAPNLYKGFETVVRCAELLDRRGIRFRWNVAGLRVDDRMVALSQSATSVKLSPSVHLLGRLDEIALAEQMLASDVYVGVSHIENSPNSLCEAQLLGLPCVATYAGGTSSLITDGRDGVLVQDGDPYVLAGAIVELARDPERAAVLGANARTRALQRHDRAAITRAVLDIYGRMVSGR